MKEIDKKLLDSLATWFGEEKAKEYLLESMKNPPKYTLKKGAIDKVVIIKKEDTLN